MSGNLLYVEASDLVVLGVLAAAVFGLHALFYRSFLFVSFDMETARAVGLRASSYDFLLYVTIGISIAVTMKVAGLLFVFGSLVVSPLFGLLLHRRLKWIFALSILFSVVTSFAGIVISILFDWPTSPTMLVTACVLFCAVALVKGAVGLLKS